jgi:hypothetical protein
VTQKTGSRPDSGKRPWWKKPPFGYLCATLVFVACGPTLDALCSVAPQPLPRALPYAGGVALALFLCVLLSRRQTLHTDGPVDTASARPTCATSRSRSPRTLLDERSRVTKTILWTAALTLIGAASQPR